MVYEGSTAHCQSSPGELLLSRESQWWSLTELGAEVWVAHSEEVSRARLPSWARGVPGKGSAHAEKGPGLYVLPKWHLPGLPSSTDVPFI